MTAELQEPAAEVREGAVEWLALLGRSMREEHDYRPRIEGRLPAGLAGTLYRNGPGLFERGGRRKRNLLDGDGMIQAFDFADGAVRYRNRFVRTAKFQAEEAAGAYRYPTWSTRAPGGPLFNLGFRGKSQAGVTVLAQGGRLLAFDEINPPYALDPETLETLGAYEVETRYPVPAYKAHSKTDAGNGDWVLIGTGYGKKMTLHHVVRGADGRVKAQRHFEAPYNTYLHDFFATERYVLFLLHPVEFSPWPLISGFKSFIDTLKWNPARGNLVLVADKSGAAPPRVFEAPAAYMWHSLNAYEVGDSIVADFVGYDDPDHFIGDDPALGAIMRGVAGNAESPGRLRRHVIDLGAGRLREEFLADGHYEFPMIDARVGCRRHRYAYLAHGDASRWFHDGLARVDVETGARELYDFGPSCYVGEPIFAPRGPDEGDGWLLVQVLDGTTEKGFLALFDAADVAAGPVARVLLDHPTPMSFHGDWRAAG